MNKKTLFLVITLTAMLILVTSVNATTDNTNTSTTHSISEKTTTTEPVVKEIQKQEKTPEQAKINKEIKKTNKTLKNKKTNTHIIEVTDTNSLLNAVTQINSGTGDEYLILLKEGDYNLNNQNIAINGENKITLNGNNQIIYSVNQLQAYSNELIINNLNLNAKTFTNQKNTVYIKNSTFNITSRFRVNGGIIFFDDNTKINANNINYLNNATIYTNDTELIELFKNKGATDEYINPPIYEGIIENTTISKHIFINGHCIFINCSITGHIKNHGTLTLLNCNLSNVESNGDNTYNALFIDNYGNLTITGCVMENNTYNGDSSNNNQFGMIYNNATLVIDNCTFQNNFGRRQAGVIYAYNNIVNTPISNTNIMINNSVFRNNSISPDGGERDTHDGGAISLTHGNITITNTIFENHHIESSNRNNRVGDGGALYLVYANANITNTTFNNNSYKLLGQYDGEGARGAGIYSQISNLTVTDSQFNDNWVESISGWNNQGAMGAAINCYVYYDEKIIIQNNTFNNNKAIYNIDYNIYERDYQGYYTIRGVGGSIAIDNVNYYSEPNEEQYIQISENQFTNSNAKYGEAIYSTWNNINLYNNTFTNINGESDTIYFFNTTNKQKTIENNKYNNCSFTYNKYELTAPDKIYTGDNITLKLEMELSNPEFYDDNLLEQTEYTWYINGETTTNKETEMNITVTEDNIIIYVKPTIENTRTKTLTIIPTILNDIIITPENINKYLFEGELIVNHNSRLIFQGDFTDIDEIKNNKNEVLFDGSSATFTNTYFTIEANNNTLKNMNINNTDISKYIITLTGNDTTITNNTLTQYNTNGQTAAIYNKNGQNNKITHNNIKITGPALAITWTGTTGASNTQAILTIGGKNNIIEYNNISITNSTNPESEPFSNIEAITASQESNTTISYNNIKSTGARFNYGINTLKDVQENQIAYNNITVTGYRYADGIQVGNGATDNIISNNNIQITCLNDTPVDEAAISYGIIITNQGGQTSNNNTITQNNIEINGIVNYGMEIYTATNTLITDNTITLTGAKSMGIGYAHSPNSTITENTIKTNDDSSIPINGITEEIQPLNTGIRIQQESENILIQDNTIQTYDKNGQDTCINIESNNVTIKNNNLTSTTKTGDNTITTTKPDTIIDNNNAIEQESTTQTATEDLIIGESTALTAQFYDDTYTPVGNGKAIFKVNGKTLRDNQGNVIYADVINGRAELPDVNITQEWTKEGTTIQAVYIGDDNNEPITTTPTTVTVTKPEATITLDAPTTANAGETITLKATLTDDDAAVNSGRVAFKLNGKTLKDPKTGKALYANVENGIATITYTIPEKTKAKEYTLTVVFTDTNYDRVEAESKLNVVKA